MEEIARIRAPAGRGLVAVGTAGGQVALLDPHNGMRAGAPLTAHAGGLKALDAREDLVVTCGLNLRLGQPVADQYVRVRCRDPAP